MEFVKKIIQKLAQKSENSITVLIIIAIFIVVNFLSYQVFIRKDLTQEKIYSISNASKEIVKDLDDIVQIKLYFSDNLPNQYIKTRQVVNDILSEYYTYSNGKIDIQHINPKEDIENPQQTLGMIGIPALQFNVMQNDSYQVMQGYMGIVIQYGDKMESIPVVDKIDDFEYKITMAIKKVVNTNIPSVGLVVNYGVLLQDGGLKTAYEKLAEVYNVKDVDLSSSEEIPADVKTLVLPGAKEEIPEEELKKIDAFLLAGNSLMILADGIDITDGLVTTENSSGIDKLLKKHGVILNKDVVMDVSNGKVSFSSGFMQFFTGYPAWVKVIKDNFNQNNSAVSELESATFPWASSLEIVEDIDDGKEVVYLAKTTKMAWKQSGDFNLNPKEVGTRGSEQYSLAFLLSGKFTSAYDEDLTTDNGRLLVVGDSDFVNDDFIKRNQGNLVLFQNLIDSITLGDDLIKIRSKGITDRSIKELDATQKKYFKYGNIFGITLIVIIGGMLRYFLRKRKKLEI